MKDFTTHDSKHLTLNDRKIIETGIKNGSTKKAIADTIGKDSSTVAKEIRLHRQLSHKSRYHTQCALFASCKPGNSCPQDCCDFVPFSCTRRDRSPGACNGCSYWQKCPYDRYTYNADSAFEEYRYTLSDSREGINMTSAELKRIADIIKPLLSQGQSVYQIVIDHPELGVSERTIYNYFEQDVFQFHDLGNIDLRRKVGRKVPKKKSNLYKKRKEKKYLNGRNYSDFKEYVLNNPCCRIQEMDTVYNSIENGPFIQTFQMRGTHLIVGVFHESKTSEDMLNGIRYLDEVLGHDVFNKYFEVILTDRGSEFTKADEAEMRHDGTRRTRLFYCDPMQASQKGSLENKHEMLRYILPKETDLYALGLADQKALNLVLSHINSTPIESLNGKTPMEYVEFMYPDLHEKLLYFGLELIQKDEVILKPYLLRQLNE